LNEIYIFGWNFIRGFKFV